MPLLPLITGLSMGVGGIVGKRAGFPELGPKQSRNLLTDRLYTDDGLE